MTFVRKTQKYHDEANAQNAESALFTLSSFVSGPQCAMAHLDGQFWHFGVKKLCTSDAQTNKSETTFKSTSPKNDAELPFVRSVFLPLLDGISSNF